MEITYQVGDADEHPVDKSSHCSDVREPVEDILSRVRQVQEGQQADYPGDENGHVGHAVAVASGEDLGGLAATGERIQRSRTSKQPCVTRGPG